VNRGDLGEVWEFAKRHKGLVASVVLPTLLVFRFPGPVMMAMRFVPQALLTLVALAVRVGGTSGLHSLWKLVGHLVSTGASGAAAQARAYTAARKLHREAGRRAAEEKARAQTRSGGGGSGSGGSAGRRGRWK